MVTGFLSPTHIVLLLIVVLLLFGAKRLPEMGRSLGTGLRGFKHGLEGKEPEQLELRQPPTERD
jgi:sec-independent protein translocase protein TatA